MTHLTRRVCRSVWAALTARLRGDSSSTTGSDTAGFPRSIPDGGVTITEDPDTAGTKQTDTASSAGDDGDTTFESREIDPVVADREATTTDEGSAATETPPAAIDFDHTTLLNSLDRPAFILDASGELSAWNDPLAKQLDTADLDAETVADRLTIDGVELTLAEMVAAEPTNADGEFGVTLADRNRFLYRDSGTIAGDDTTHIETTARPLFDDDVVAGVIQIITDRTAEHRRQEASKKLVSELRSTLSGLATGNLGVRADPPADTDLIVEGLGDVVTELNEAIEQLESMAGGIERQTRQLDDYIEAADAAADDIATNVAEQSELLDESVDEMQSFSASMEEVASTAEEVDTAAEEARTAAENGLEASEGAKDATDEVVEIGDELVEQVTALGEQMDDIEAVIEVIDDIAEQTNILALNANIEAARAGEEGDGFAVVAEEVKNLADKTQTHTEEIADSINRLHQQTDETVASATESHEQIGHAGEQIADVLDAFEEIADSIDQAANGIAEVSRATDEQAATVEELTATLETVRDRSADTENATERIVGATDDQRTAVEELTRKLRQLQR